jgi:ASC-1-like (ASCH) protein
MSRKHLSEPWFSLVRSGRKTHEGRINIGFWSTLKVGDALTFYNNDDGEKEFNVQIEEILHFKSFSEGINEIGLQNVLPPYAELGDIEYAVKKVYYEYFKPEDEELNGIVMLKFLIL